MELNEEEKRQLLQVDGDCQAKDVYKRQAVKEGVDAKEVVNKHRDNQQRIHFAFTNGTVIFLSLIHIFP